jgi:hypothetical protein
MTTPQPPGPKIIVPEGMEPAYANLARISHSPADIVIDFAHILPGETTATSARVVMTPLSAKLLLRHSVRILDVTRQPLVRSQCQVTARWLESFGRHPPSHRKSSFADSVVRIES